jgi:hypothetical protein
MQIQHIAGVSLRAMLCPSPGNGVRRISELNLLQQLPQIYKLSHLLRETLCVMF